jgi:hypothetical protein
LTKNPFPKRPRANSEDDQHLLDEILPGAAAAKRRRLHGDANDTASIGEHRPNQRPKEKDINILKVAAEHRKAVDEADKLEQQANAVLADEDIRGLKDIAGVEEFEISHRGKPGSLGGKTTSWEGRKNFKGFKRRGIHSTPKTVSSALVEISKYAAQDDLSDSSVQDLAAGDARKGDINAKMDHNEELPRSKQRQSKMVETTQLLKQGKSRQTKLNTVVSAESDSEDELRFKFIKKRR